MRVNGLVFFCLLLAAMPAGANELQSGDEIITEPLLPAEQTPTPAPRRTRKTSPLVYQGKVIAPRAYSGSVPRRSSSAPRAAREVELANEPVTDSGRFPASAPTPTPVPKPKAARDARQYSYSAQEAGTSVPAGRTDPELAPLAPLGGRELRTEPLAEDEATRGAASRADAVAFTAELNRNSVHLDESFTLTAVITVPELQHVSEVRFNRPEAFDLINTHHTDLRTNERGRILQTRTVSYVFLPLKTGTFTLPPAEIRYRGRAYRTAAMEITVEGPRTGFAYQRQFTGRKGQKPVILPAAPDTAGSGKENSVTFYANLDQRAAYVNQQVTLTVRLRYLYENGIKVAYLPPPLTGFLSEPLQQTQTEAVVSGTHQKYLERVYRTALFPIQSGTLSISSAKAQFAKFGQSHSHSTEPLSLESKPLPPDPELKTGEISSGLVGRYQLTANLLPGRVEAEMPLRLRLVLQGEGNIRAAPDPNISADPSLRLQVESRGEAITRDNGLVRGERVFQYVLVPRKPGALALGRAWIRYFDPQSKAWRSAAAALPAVNVLPKAETEEPASPAAAESTLRAPQHLRPIHGGGDVLRRLNRRATATWRFWLLQVAGLIALGAAGLFSQARRKVLGDPQVLRARRAYGLARGLLRRAHGHIRKGEVTLFYDSLSRAASEYLAAKFGVPTSYIVSERLTEYFERHQVPMIFRSRFKIALTACEYVRYAAVELPTHDMRSLHRDLAAAVEEFEAHWRKVGRARKNIPAGPAAAILLVLALGAAARAGEPEICFLHGNTAFEQEQFETALADYQNVIALGVADPDVYYNLGNTYIKLGQIGRAILAYEKGLQLAPRDGDLRHNLAEAASAAVDAQPEESTRSYRGWVTRAYRLFTADELAYAASAAYFVLVAGLILWLLWPAHARAGRRLTAASAVLLALLAGWSAARGLESSWWRRAVVLTPAAEVLGRPYADAEKLYTVHEGTRVAVGREEEEWMEVHFGRNRRGWCARGALGMIE